MISLRDIFKKYTGSLRSYKAVYTINNFLNNSYLKHNKDLYKKYKVNKSLYAAIGHHDFKPKQEDIPWIDQPNAKQKALESPEFKTFDEATQIQILSFIDNGFMILKGFYKDEEVNKLNGEVDNLLNSNAVDFNYSGKKVMDAFRNSTIVDSYFRHQKMLKLLNFVMGKKVIPFQTINFIQGSEQRAHSDSIHMTTEPFGYLVATWAALEDCYDGNGPLFYYPKSHRLPFVSCEDYNSGNSKWRIGANSNKNYEDKIAELLEKHQLEKAYFHAEKGDVLVWHANLIHGGDPIRKTGTTRKSMVAHYYCEDVICYHEMTQRPALMKL